MNFKVKKICSAVAVLLVTTAQAQTESINIV